MAKRTIRRVAFKNRFLLTGKWLEILLYNE